MVMMIPGPQKCDRQIWVALVDRMAKEGRNMSRDQRSDGIDDLRDISHSCSLLLGDGWENNWVDLPWLQQFPAPKNVMGVNASAPGRQNK